MRHLIRLLVAVVAVVAMAACEREAHTDTSFTSFEECLDYAEDHNYPSDVCASLPSGVAID